MYNTVFSFFLSQLLKSKLTDLREEQVEELASKLPEGDVTFKDFQATGKEAVLKIYQVRDQTDVSTCIIRDTSSICCSVIVV